MCVCMSMDLLILCINRRHAWAACSGIEEMHVHRGQALAALKLHKWQGEYDGIRSKMHSSLTGTEHSLHQAQMVTTTAPVRAGFPELPSNVTAGLGSRPPPWLAVIQLHSTLLSLLVSPHRHICLFLPGLFTQALSFIPSWSLLTGTTGQRTPQWQSQQSCPRKAWSSKQGSKQVEAQALKQGLLVQGGRRAVKARAKEGDVSFGLCCAWAGHKVCKDPLSNLLWRHFFDRLLSDAMSECPG